MQGHAEPATQVNPENRHMFPAKSPNGTSASYQAGTPPSSQRPARNADQAGTLPALSSAAAVASVREFRERRRGLQFSWTWVPTLSLW